MEKKKEDWYKEGWTLDIKNQSWVEDTGSQVDFLIQTLGLQGNERILDLACGYGRHSLEFAKRGYQVVGVDITKEYVEDANKEAGAAGLPAHFYQKDIRQVDYNEEFDVVINMADGAIGYLENDEENVKIFDVVSRALKPGGKHFMDIMSADYADAHFPCNLWEAGDISLTLSRFEWDKESKVMLYGQNDFSYGNPLAKPNFAAGDPIRLFHAQEIKDLLSARGMDVVKIFGKFDGTPASANEIQMMVCSQKSGEK